MKKHKFAHPVKNKLEEQLAGTGYGEYGSELVRYRLPEEVALRIKHSASTLKLTFNYEIIRRLCVFFLKTHESKNAKCEFRIMDEVASEFLQSIELSKEKLNQNHENNLIRFLTASMHNVSFQKSDSNVTVGNFHIDTIIFNDIKLTAQLHKRSVNSEIISRLERSLNLEYPNEKEIEKIRKLQLLLLLTESYIQREMRPA